MSSYLRVSEGLAYGVADVGASLSYNAINFFLLFFLVEICGLQASLAGLVLLSGRVIDALTDPLMGILSDRTQSRWGRRRPYILAGAIPFGLTFALLWFIPVGSQELMFTVAALTLTLHTLVYTVVQVPYMALTPELAPDYEARTSLTSYRIGFGTFASLIAAAAPPLLVALLNSSQNLPENARQGWGLMGILFGILMSVSYLLMVFNVREPQREVVALKPVNFLESYRSVFSVYGYRGILLLFVLVTLGIGIISSMLPFYLASSLRLDAGAQTLALGLLFVVAILALPFWNGLSSRWGKPKAFSLGLGLLALSVVLLVFLSPPGSLSPALLGFVALAGVGTGAALLFPWAMLPDVVEFDELTSGERREGLLYAVFTFGQKTAFAFGAFLNAQVLGAVGYLPEATVQSEAAVRGIGMMVGPVAALAFAAGLLVLRRYPITQAQHEAVRAQLQARQ